MKPSLFASLIGITLFYVTASCAYGHRDLAGARIPQSTNLPGQFSDLDVYARSPSDFHLIWRQFSVNEYGAPINGTWYRHGDPISHRWAPPVALITDEAFHGRFAVVGAAIHVIGGNRLRDLVSFDNGATWKPGSSMLSDNGPAIAEYFDLAPLGDRLLVAYDGPSFDQSSRAASECRVVSRDGSGELKNLLLFRFPTSVELQAPPALYVADQVAYCVCSDNRSARRAVEGGQQITYAGGACVFVSTDKGQSWSGPRRLSPTNGSMDPVTEIRCSRIGRGDYALLNASGRILYVQLSATQDSMLRVLDMPRVSNVFSDNPQDFACGQVGPNEWVVASAAMSALREEEGKEAEAVDSIRVASVAEGENGLRGSLGTVRAASSPPLTGLRLVTTGGTATLLWTAGAGSDSGHQAIIDRHGVYILRSLEAR